MILGSQSISNQSQNFNDYRYQKALKQIGKLINVNRQIKTQSEKFKAELIQLHQKNHQLLEINKTLGNEVQSLREQLFTIRKSNEQLSNFCKSVEFEQKQLLKSKQNQTITKVQMEKNYKEQINKLRSLFQQQINDLMAKIHTKDRQINLLQQKSEIIKQLQAQNNKLHQQYEIVLRQNQQLLVKVDQLSNQLINTSIRIKQQPNQELINKLKINQDWIKSLNEENYNLKQKILQDEYNKEKEKCNETIFQNVNNFKSFLNIPSVPANDILIKQFVKQAQKKLKKVTEEKKNLQTKYDKLKAKYSHLQSLSHQSQKQLNLLKVKINGYEQLTEKQQAEIQRMIVEFNQQMDKVTKKNKQRVLSKGQLELPSSPAHISKQKQLKALIQNLQKEISQCQTQSQQKKKLIQFLQRKIQLIQQQKMVLQTTNKELTEQLASYKDLDLSKTSKNYTKDRQLIKTQSLGKNGSKVFIINGKKYESKLLKNNQTDSILQSERPVNISGFQKLQQSLQISQQSNIRYPTNQISYISSRRNYENLTPHYLSRA